MIGRMKGGKGGEGGGGEAPPGRASR